MTDPVTIIGGGLAGSEAAMQLARRGCEVRLLEMKPGQRTAAQQSDQLGELVCSNSLRSSNPVNAVGLLKQEMRRLGSFVIATADACRVPAGDALAVDRERFAQAISEGLRGNDRITVVEQRVDALPGPSAGETIVATGPLTADALAADLAAKTTSERLFFHDAIAPIISGDSIDRAIAFEASRYGKGESSDYLNCPMDRGEYGAFLEALIAADTLPLHSFEQPIFFEGCLPVEEVAGRGRDSLRFGCMKPVGLEDPRRPGRPFAVLQLRKEDAAGQAYNLVGCQTKLKYPDQRRVFRMIPGLGSAEFLRLGAMHRNTYLDSPVLLDERGRLRTQPNIRFAGQITGVEGYVESAAHGLLIALLLAGDQASREIPAPPRETALGALWGHVRGEARIKGRHHEPQNVNWGLFPPLPPGTKKSEKKTQRVLRAVASLEGWAQEHTVELGVSQIDPESSGRRAERELDAAFFAARPR